jgi:hypothetical protein
MNIKFPKILKPNTVPIFLYETERIFGMENTLTPDVKIDMGKIKKTSLLGVLLGYKLLEYTYNHHCFKKPELIVDQQGYIEVQWRKYGFYDLIHLFISNKDITEIGYRKLEVKVSEKFIIAPQPLLRSNNYSNEVLKKKFLPSIEEYYKDNEKVVQMIFLSLSEILLNFWEHAIQDTKSILVAEGNKQHIEIACADTGNGIISTLKQAKHIKETSPIDILKNAVNKGVTSKLMSNHMGYGLWILNELVNLTKGSLHLYSEGVYYQNNYGKVKTGKCGFWQGTIIHLTLPLENPKTLADIEKFDNDNFSNLKINWN